MIAAIKVAKAAVASEIQMAFLARLYVRVGLKGSVVVVKLHDTWLPIMVVDTV